MQTDTERGELQGDYWSHGLGSLGGTKKAGPLLTQTRDQAGATVGPFISWQPWLSLLPCGLERGQRKGEELS